MRKCVKCGYCCTVQACVFGEWDSAKGQCAFLTEDNLCAKYDEIRGVPGSEVSPAFGAGCSSSLFNDRREAKVRSLAGAEAVKGEAGENAGQFSISLSVPGIARVLVPKAIEFVRDGKVVGHVDAEYDFSGLPEDLHEFALAAIKRPTQVILAL